MSRFSRTTLTLLKQERGSALRNVLILGCVAVAFFSVANSYAAAVMGVVERIASRLVL
jgi:hypothetical protein